MMAVNFRFSSHLTADESRLMRENRDWMVRVEDFPVLRAKSVKMKAKVLRTGEGRALEEDVMLYVQQGSGADTIEYGDILLLSTLFSEIEPPKNPDAFDNQLYMKRKGIYYTGYVQQGCWLPAGHAPANPLRALAHRMQSRLSALFARSGMTGSELEIVKAILLGDDDTMEPELKASYAAAGVSHILCVSGMHVGVIFMILNFLLRPLDLFKSTRYLKALLILLVIWLYAHITGLSPSVTRSATMFTFVTIGQLIQRNTNVFHSLLASLWILLVVNPLLLFELGFQLSYLAVGGIVLLQPLLAGIYNCRTRMGTYFWSLITVSVAAQISTFPISVHYFGQFPNYFLLSNMSVIMLSFVVMMTGIVLLCVSAVPFAGSMVTFLLTWEIRIMNGIVTFVEQLPGAVTRGIEVTPTQMLLLYMVIILAYWAIRYRKKRVGMAALTCFALYAGTLLIRKVELQRQVEMVVYAVPKTSVLSFCHQQQCVVFSDSIVDAGDKRFQYAAANHKRRQHAAYVFVPVDTMAYDNGFLCKRDSWIWFNGKTYYLINRKEKVYPMSEPVPVDVLILQHNPVQLPDEVAQVLSFQEVIADETNTKFYIERWREWCKEHGVPFSL
jgi:competence protein ComEC